MDRITWFDIQIRQIVNCFAGKPPDKQLPFPVAEFRKSFRGGGNDRWRTVPADGLVPLFSTVARRVSRCSDGGGQQEPGRLISLRRTCWFPPRDLQPQGRGSDDPFEPRHRGRVGLPAQRRLLGIAGVWTSGAVTVGSMQRSVRRSDSHRLHEQGPLARSVDQVSWPPMAQRCTDAVPRRSNVSI
jgi:hypothetical protein